jgi:DUF1009 family protein
MNAVPEVLGLIAGNGRYPVLITQAALKQGVKRICAVGFNDETEREVKELAHDYLQLRVGELGHLLRHFREKKVTHAIMAGQIKPAHLFDLRPDMRALLLLARLRERNAESIFRAIADDLKSVSGVELLPATTFLEDCLPEPGHIAGPRLNRSQLQDVEFGFRIAKQTSALDIGQSVVVKKGTVLAVEAFEGTDVTMERGGKLAGPRGGGILVKVSKPNQDLRFDVPVIGSRTLDRAKAANISVIACEARLTLLLDKPALVKQAQQLGIALFAIGAEK